LCDYEQILMFEAGIRGGLTQTSIWYARANNKEVPEYDPSKPDLWIVYLDTTNLYVLYLPHKNEWILIVFNLTAMVGQCQKTCLKVDFNGITKINTMKTFKNYWKTLMIRYGRYFIPSFIT